MPVVHIHLRCEAMIETIDVAMATIGQEEGGAFLLAPAEASLVVGLQAMEDGWVAPGSQSRACR